MKLAPLALAALLLASAGCKTDAPAWLNLPPPVERHGIAIVTDGVKRLSFWFLGLTGEATNQSTNDYASCTITYDCLDKLGKKIGTAVATCEDFESGATWSFTASIQEADVRDVELVSAPVVRVQAR